jgi:Short C-terminal domain
MLLMRIMGIGFIILGAAFLFLRISNMPGYGFMMFAIFGIVGLVFIVIDRLTAQGQAQAAALMLRGKPASATVTSIADTGITINDNPRVRLTLHVVPQDEEPFDVVKAVTVSRVSIPQVGQTFAIKYDPDNKTDFAFDNSGSAAASSGAGGVASALSDPATLPADTVSQLERLTALRDRGVLTSDEFEAQKKRILGE